MEPLKPDAEASDQRRLGEQFLLVALNDPTAQFRDGQWEAIEFLITAGKRLLLVQRTGWGKSIVYFLATRFLRDRKLGPTLLISPLLSLMRNQMLAAKNLKMEAVSVNSENREEWQSVRERLRGDKIDILLIAPERLANESFREEYLLPVLPRVGLFVVDEAHCISDWGHDFRPDYRRIGRIVRLLPPNVPLLATTATANDRVVQDIVEQFGGDVRVMRGPLRRDTLILQNIRLSDPAARLAWLTDYVPRLPGSGIIYTLTKHDAERTADWLVQRGINARAYHSDIDPGGTGQREKLEQMLLHNEIKALVATTALGMGFDKPDMGFVIHYQKPGSVVHYYQQVGRAGRAVKRAFCILFWGGEDDEILDYFLNTALPTGTHIESVLKALEESGEGLTQRELERRLNVTFGDIERVLKFLSAEYPQPIVKVQSKWLRAPVPYEVDRERVKKLMSLRLHERRRMREYMDSHECLMMFLTRELNDPEAAPCGKCASCRGEPVVPLEGREDSLRAAQLFLQRLELPLEPRQMAPAGALAGYGIVKSKIPEEWRCESGKILCRWGDPGLGQLVRAGKYESARFDDRLVAAAAELITERWKLEPFPRWGTSVPSFRHPKLVRDFAKRLCRALKIPYYDCLHKLKQNLPQKEMENSFHQAHNLDGVFTVDSLGKVADLPVLLIDDMVDSGWTLTVAGLVLRRAGAGKVHPFALARTTRGDNR